jgi:hypothetical protein
MGPLVVACRSPIGEQGYLPAGDLAAYYSARGGVLHHPTSAILGLKLLNFVSFTHPAKRQPWKQGGMVTNPRETQANSSASVAGSSFKALGMEKMIKWLAARKLFCFCLPFPVLGLRSFLYS